MVDLPDPIVGYIGDRVRAREPTRLLVVAAAADRAHAIVKAAGVDCSLTHCTPAQAEAYVAHGDRWSLAVVTDALETLPRYRAQRLLGRLRDFKAAGVLVVSGPISTRPAKSHTWSQAEFIALGFRRCTGSRDLAAGWRLYRYDIHDYKTTPSWLNSRYWANPERWDKDRW